MRPATLLADLIDLVAPRECAACDASLRRREGSFCDACAPLLDALPHGPARYAFGGPLAEAIRRYKYGRREDLAAPLGDLLAAAAPAWLGRVDSVVPIPPTRRSVRRRGFDSTALLAEPLARVLGVPLRRDVLHRRRETPPQVSLGAEARRRALDGVFEARRIAGERVLLLDDVSTTGATLDAGTEALLAAGAEVVHRVTLAGSESLSLRPHDAPPG